MFAQGVRHVGISWLDKSLPRNVVLPSEIGFGRALATDENQNDHGAMLSRFCNACKVPQTEMRVAREESRMATALPCPKPYRTRLCSKCYNARLCRLSAWLPPATRQFCIRTTGLSYSFNLVSRPCAKAQLDQLLPSMSSTRTSQHRSHPKSDSERRNCALHDYFQTAALAPHT